LVNLVNNSILEKSISIILGALKFLHALYRRYRRGDKIKIIIINYYFLNPSTLTYHNIFLKNESYSRHLNEEYLY